MGSETAIDHELLKAQLEKLRLEIDTLKSKQRSSIATVMQDYSAIVTALIAVAGFLFGIYTFNKDQALRQKAQLEAQNAQLQAQKERWAEMDAQRFANPARRQCRQKIHDQ